MSGWAWVEPVAGLLGLSLSVLLQRRLPLHAVRVTIRTRLVDLLSIAMAIAVSVTVRAWWSEPLGWQARPLRTLAAIALFDLGLYVVHRLNHTRLAWAMHRVHHAPTHFDVGMAMRGSLSYLLLFAVGLHALASWLALSAAELALVSAVFFAYQWWIHANVGLSLGWLDWVLIGPRHHALHHTRGGASRNFGGLLCVWDQLGGTYLHPVESDIAYRFGIADGTSSVWAWLGMGAWASQKSQG